MLVAYLVSSCGAHINNRGSVNLLMLAAEKNHLNIFAYLVQHGALIDARDPETGNTALYIAAERDYELVCQTLVESGANINETNIDGQSALFIAAHKGHFNVCKYLINLCFVIALSYNAVSIKSGCIQRPNFFMFHLIFLFLQSPVKYLIKY